MTYVTRPLKKHWPLLAVLLIACVLLRAWLNAGELLGSDWIRRTPEELATFFPWPHVWNGAQQIGENTSVYLTEYPLLAGMGLMARLHVPWTVIERLCYFFPYLLLGAVAPYVLAYRLTRSPLACGICALYYSFNPWMIQSIERGAIPSMVAVAIIPFVVLQALRVLEKPLVRPSIKLAFLIFGVVVYDLRYAIIACLIVLVLVVESTLRKGLSSYTNQVARQAFVVGATLLCLNLYWLLPQFIAPANPGAGYGSLDDYRQVSGSFTAAHALTNVEPFYHWVASNPAFDATVPDPPFFVIPALIFASLALTWRRRYTKSFGTIAFGALVLSSGLSVPFGPLNTFIYTHVPLMTLFRDINKWMSATTLAYALLLAFGASRGMAFVRLLWPRRTPTITRFAFCGALILYILLMNDAFNPMRYRLFSTYPIAEDTRALEAFLRDQPHYSRTLIYPRDLESMRADETHPYLEAQPFFLNPSYGGARFLNYDMGSTTTAYANPLTPNLLRSLNVRYIVVPYDDDRIVYKPQMASMEFGDAVAFIQHQPYVHFVRKIGRHYVFEINHPMPERGFVAPLPFVFGGSGLALAAVAPTALWNSQAAAILVDQPLPQSVRSLAAGFIDAPSLVDTNVSGPRTMDLIRNQASAYRAASPHRYAIRGIAATTASSTASIYASVRSQTLDAAFPAGVMNEPQTVYAMVATPPQATTTLFTKTLRLRIRTGIVGFPVEAEWNDRVSLSASTFRDGAALSVYNPNMQRAFGTLIVQNVRFQGALPQSLRCICPGDTATADLIDRKASTVTVVLRNITVAPGTTTVTLLGQGLFSARIPQGASFVAADKHPELPRTVLWANVLHEALSLSEYPMFQLTGYTLHGKAVPSLLFQVESSSGRPSLLFERPLDELMRSGPLDVRALVEQSLQRQFQTSLSTHRDDPGWLKEHRLRDEPDGASDYRITAIDAVARNATAGPLRPSNLVVRGSILRASPSADPERESSPTLRHARFDGIGAGGFEIFSLKSSGTVVRVIARASHTSARLTLRYFLSAPDGAPIIGIKFFTPSGYTARVRFAAKNGSVAFAESTPSPPAKHGIRTATWPVLTDSTGLATSAQIVRCLPRPCTSPVNPGGSWRRLLLDTTALEDRDADIVRSARELEVTFVGNGRPVTHRSAQFMAIVSPNTWPKKGDALDGLTIDQRGVITREVHASETPRLLSVSGRAPLNRLGINRLQTAPVEPFQPKSALVASGIPPSWRPGAALKDINVFSPTEVEGTLATSGGLFVFTEGFDPAWRLATLPGGENATGWALLDYARFHSFFSQDHSHIAINGLVNGWQLPRGSYHLLLLMSSQAFSEFGALVTLCLLPLWILTLLVWGPRIVTVYGWLLSRPGSSPSSRLP